MSSIIVFVSQMRPVIKPVELFIILLFICFAAAPNVPAADFVVTTNADNGAGSLREALAAAGANSQPDTITFNSLFNTEQIITLNGELVVAADGGNALTITGTGANLLAISGNNQSRVLFINSGANVSISGVTIRKGRVSGIDGITSGAMNGDGTNATNEVGGGIFNQGALTLTNVVVFNNTVIGGNEHNLIENLPAGGVGGNQTGNIYNQDPRLTPLGNYGGATQIVALLSGSPAINAGSNTIAGTPAADQRGTNRQGNPDIGAFEVNNAYIAATPSARANQEYNLILAPDSQNFTFALAPESNALPPGLVLTTSFAPEAVVAITGTPTLAGTYNITIRATDAGGNFIDTNYQIIVAADPTAASVTVGGRVTTADGDGIRHARVTITDSNGNSRTILTGKFGAYRFQDVATGETYIISVSARHYRFSQPSQVRTVSEDLTDVDFVAENQ